jgi:hypothetical protein
MAWHKYLGNLLLAFVSIGCQAPKGDVLKEAYRREVITLDPPLQRYGKIDANWDDGLLARPDLKGVRVDLNVPHHAPRKFGDHPAALCYFFESGESLMDYFDESGKFIQRYDSAGQSSDGVDFNYPR